MLFISTLIGKTTLAILHLFGRKGSALPGLVVEKLNKNFLTSSLGQLPRGFMVVSGTNGKTTTTKIIVELLRSHGLRVVTNPTGSNFVRGIVGALVESSTLSGRLPYDVAIFEQDEAHAVQLIKSVRPNGVVLLNVMRDQMDRFGEIDKTAELLGKLAGSARDFVVLNTNDRRIANIQDKVTAENIIWFGHSRELLSQFRDDDQHHRGQASLKYYMAAHPDVMLSEIGEHEILLDIGEQSYKTELQLAGTHNALNIAAAVATLQAILPEAPLSSSLQAVAAILPAFGRGELIQLNNGTFLRLQLVKNPAGFIHALRQLSSHNYSAVGIAINDNDPDGRDVSWLWDVDFSILKDLSIPINCGGIRAFDMAVRLKYDEIETANTKTDLKQFVESMYSNVHSGENSILFCTYTAMLEIRQLLKKEATKMGQGL